VYRYRLFDADGADQGEAYYAVLIEVRATHLGRRLPASYACSTSCRSRRRTWAFVGFLKVESA
jgi:hypothetical protein